jgi:L-ribulokinase
MNQQYVIGLDYGTNSVRALIVNVENGAEVGTATWNYTHGEAGITLSRDPQSALASIPPITSKAHSTRFAPRWKGAKVDGFEASQIIGIGVDTTGSTPIPLTQMAFRLPSIRVLGATPTPGVAVERSYECRRSHANHPVGRGDSP